MAAEIRTVEPEGLVVAAERPINVFPLQRIRETTIEEMLESVFSTVSVPRLYS
jgi:hypothetical protein